MEQFFGLRALGLRLGKVRLRYRSIIAGLVNALFKCRWASRWSARLLPISHLRLALLVQLRLRLGLLDPLRQG
jgi:hypothetical protein